MALELLAFVAGIYYLKKVPATYSWNRYFVYFLGITFLMEFLAIYAVIGYFSEYKYFSWIEGTLIESSNWIYNIYIPFSYIFLQLYFGSLLNNKLIKKVSNALAILFGVFVIFFYATTGSFFEEQSAYTNFVGTFLVMFGIITYYFELLRSDKILKLTALLPFYFSLGVLVFNLCVTPLSIFSKYFSVASGNMSYIHLQIQVVLISNIFMYSCFIIGFLLCSRKNKSY